MNKKHSPTFRKWFVSYCLILVLCVIAGMGISMYAREISFRQTQQVYDGLMRQVQIDIDSYVREAFRLFDRITLNNNIVKLAESRSEKNPYLDYLASQDVAKYVAENSFIQDIFLINNNTGKVLFPNGYLDLETFYTLYYSGWSSDFGEFAEQIAQESNQGQIILRNSAGETLIILTKDVFIQNSGGLPLTGCVVLRSSQLIKRLNIIRWDERISIVIQNAGDTIVAAVGPHMMDAEPILLGDNADQVLEYIYGGERNSILIQNSNIVLWRYLSVTPLSVLNKSANGIGIVSILCLMSCTTIGILLSLRFTRRNYKPLRDVMAVFKRNLPSTKSSEEYDDEYVWLKQAVDQYIKELESSHSRLEDYHRNMCNHVLFRLLETPFDLRRDAKEMRRVGLEFQERCFLVLNFYFEESQALLLSSDIEKGRGALGFAIVNIFTEMIGTKYNIKITDMGDRIGVIMGLPENDPAHVEQVWQAVFLCQENIEKHLGAVVLCGMGTIYSGMDGIYLSSREAKEAGEYLNASDASRTILYEEIKDRRVGYCYPMEVEQQIVGAIYAGNREAATSYLLQVLDMNRHVMGEMRKCITLDIIGTAVKGANQAGIQGILGQWDFAALFSGVEEEKLLELIGNLCDTIRDERPVVSQHSSLVLAVKNFVAEHYANPDVNVSFIGAHFNLTPTYLSGLFKEQTGMGLLDYINMQRVEHAKEQLKRRENVSDVAHSVGYRNSGAFIRVFKRFEGITPGQWFAACGKETT